MAFKFIVVLALVAAASAGLLPAYPDEHQQLQYSHQPTLIKTIAHHEEHAPAEYEFSYSVHDAHTGDQKSQHETRHGDNVQGQYSLVDADGHLRTVDYSADEHSGFNAHVRREPLGHKAVHAAPIAVAHHAAPLAAYHHAAPIATAYHHAAPIASVHHVAPVTAYHHAAPAAAIHHAAPVATYHHAAPIASIHHAGPVAYSSASFSNLGHDQYSHGAHHQIAHHEQYHH